MDMQPDLFDELDALKLLQRDARTLAKQLDVIAALKPNDAEVLDVLAKGLAKWPSGDQIGKAADELRARAEGLVATAQMSRSETIRQHEADFIRQQRAAGVTLREAGANSWRIASLELEFQRENSRARVLYNREILVPYKSVRSREDLEALVASAQKALSNSALPDDALPTIFWEAYEQLRTSSQSTAAAVRVPLIDLYREVRVALVRHEIRSGKPDRKLLRTELPRWAFLYNVDLYRRIFPKLPVGHRLSFETGSQHDHQKGLAMIVNGLDASADYKSYCYVYASQDVAS